MRGADLLPWLLGGGAFAALLLGLAGSSSDAPPAAAPSGGEPAHPPLPGLRRVSSFFGWRDDPKTGERAFHRGIDLPVPPGTPVFAPWPGRVVRIDRDGVGKGVTNGNAVILEVSGYRFCFLHLAAVGVGLGERVGRGQVLGRSGATGRVTGPHLHLQVYDPRGGVVDPIPLYPPGTFSVPA